MGRWSTAPRTAGPTRPVGRGRPPLVELRRLAGAVPIGAPASRVTPRPVNAARHRIPPRFLSTDKTAAAAIAVTAAAGIRLVDQLAARKYPGYRCESLRRRAAPSVAVAATELLHLSGGVDDALVTGPERVAGGGDVDADERVRAPVAPLNRLVAGRRGAGQEGDIGGGVLEDDRLVLGVNSLFHAAPRPVFVVGCSSAQSGNGSRKADHRVG